MTKTSQTLSRRGFLASLLAAPLAAVAVTTAVTVAATQPAQADAASHDDKRTGAQPRSRDGATRGRDRKFKKKILRHRKFRGHGNFKRRSQFGRSRFGNRHHFPSRHHGVRSRGVIKFGKRRSFKSYRGWK